MEKILNYVNILLLAKAENDSMDVENTFRNERLNQNWFSSYHSETKKLN